jgi:hypothetical protein
MYNRQTDQEANTSDSNSVRQMRQVEENKQKHIIDDNAQVDLEMLQKRFGKAMYDHKIILGINNISREDQDKIIEKYKLDFIEIKQDKTQNGLKMLENYIEAIETTCKALESSARIKLQERFDNFVSEHKKLLKSINTNDQNIDIEEIINKYRHDFNMKKQCNINDLKSHIKMLEDYNRNLSVSYQKSRDDQLVKPEQKCLDEKSSALSPQIIEKIPLNEHAEEKTLENHKISQMRENIYKIRIDWNELKDDPNGHDPDSILGKTVERWKKAIENLRDHSVKADKPLLEKLKGLEELSVQVNEFIDWSRSKLGESGEVGDLAGRLRGFMEQSRREWISLGGKVEEIRNVCSKQIEEWEKKIQPDADSQHNELQQKIENLKKLEIQSNVCLEKIKDDVFMEKIEGYLDNVMDGRRAYKEFREGFVTACLQGINNETDLLTRAQIINEKFREQKIPDGLYNRALIDLNYICGYSDMNPSVREARAADGNLRCYTDEELISRGLVDAAEYKFVKKLRNRVNAKKREWKKQEGEQQRQQTPGRNPNQHGQQTPERSPDQRGQQTPERSPDQRGQQTLAQRITRKLLRMLCMHPSLQEREQRTPERSPQRRQRTPERSPQRRQRTPERSPQWRQRTPERSPNQQRGRLTPERSPQRRHELPSDSHAILHHVQELHQRVRRALGRSDLLEQLREETHRLSEHVERLIEHETNNTIRYTRYSQRNQYTLSVQETVNMMSCLRRINAIKRFIDRSLRQNG